MLETDYYVVEAIRHHPRFGELVRRRSQLSLTLMVLVLGTYSFLIALVSFAPNLLAHPVAENSSITLAVVFAVFVIVFGAVLTGLYVRRANSDLDDLSDHVVTEAKK